MDGTGPDGVASNKVETDNRSERFYEGDQSSANDDETRNSTNDTDRNTENADDGKDQEDEEDATEGSGKYKKITAEDGTVILEFTEDFPGHVIGAICRSEFGVNGPEKVEDCYSNAVRV